LFGDFDIVEFVGVERAERGAGGGCRGEAADFGAEGELVGDPAEAVADIDLDLHELAIEGPGGGDEGAAEQAGAEAFGDADVGQAQECDGAGDGLGGGRVWRHEGGEELIEPVLAVGDEGQVAGEEGVGEDGEFRPRLPLRAGGLGRGDEGGGRLLNGVAWGGEQI
jgi:hypothetical protein